MELGDKPSRYVVVVCPKCRQHAQITETGKKTLRCQHCGALLKARKLRIFGSFEELPEAVEFRTRLQAELSGKGKGTFFLKPSPEEAENPGPGNRSGKKTVQSGTETSSEKTSSRKDQRSILKEILKASGGKIGIEDFREEAVEKGVSRERFDIIMKKLMETGELYSPEPGIVKLV
ncbi:hypothetical protein MSSIT_3678 [Methanosarcina siciliae T4/M]|uniref:DUF5817 domain-containing protein n=2 Tax=Methanosarcina siciliae TaxID=38027 RepID=A0A0E3PJA6_9EURY|nr:minichromosome maintenance protein MCM [Methanosarcina siciliae]AKB30397.1 hypothetical protein MSSIT_3678 [Methanosarcina siciliae T4/M]AKB34315.1 hypothetical protein MSSIH_3625 [Methanosarcina siciliae HI350]